MPVDSSRPVTTARRESRQAGHKRTYQACRECRTAKLRCDLGDPDAPDEPPCRRCLRTGRECTFGGVYQRNEKGVVVSRTEQRGPRKGSGVAAATAVDDGMNNGIPAEGSGEVLADRSDTPVASSSRSQPETFSTYRTPLPAQPPTISTPNQSAEFKFARGEALENPADALRILCAAVEEDQPSRNIGAEYDPGVEPGRWNRWIPVRDGLLTADEASALLAFYGEKINPTHPLVPPQLFLPAYFGTLLREPILLAAMLATAARYLDLGLSFDATEPRRSRVIQGKIIQWVLQRIGYLTMGETSSRTIGTVEAFLILSEWPPRAQYLLDSVLPQNAHTGGKEPNPAKVYDDLSWTLIGLAVRIAQELELQNEATYINESEDDWSNHRRHDAWIHCISADRHASVRLARASLVQEMSMNWWDVASAFTRIPGDTTFPFPRSQLRYREGMGVAQLTHTIGLLQEQLYASPEVTAELIKTGRYESTLHRLKPELDYSWHEQLGDLPACSVFDSEGDTFSEEELMEIRWRVEFDYVRLYGNAIAMRAAQDRLLRRHKHSKTKPERIFQTNVIRMAEGSFVIEAVDAATSLVRCGVTMHRKGILRFCPCRIFLRMVFASVFLMKAVAFGASGQTEQEIVELQYQLITSLREASPDNSHISHHLSTLLSRVFPSIPAPIAHTRSEVRTNATETSYDRTSNQGNDLSDTLAPNPFSAASTLPWLGFDLPQVANGADGHALDWDTGIVSGFGYDPSSIISDIEQMLAATDDRLGGFGGI